MRIIYYIHLITTIHQVLIKKSVKYSLYVALETAASDVLCTIQINYDQNIYENRSSVQFPYDNLQCFTNELSNTGGVKTQAKR